MFLALPDPDPLVRGTGSRSISQRYGAGSESSPFLLEVLSGLKECLQKKSLTQNFSKKLNFKAEDNVPVGKFQEKNLKKIIFLHP